MKTVDELWITLKEGIAAYTGLSPAAFFTILALAIAFFYVVSGIFGSPAPRPREAAASAEEETEPLPPPVQLGEITEEELKAYDGSDPKKPLLMAIKGQIYDVSQSRCSYRSCSSFLVWSLNSQISVILVCGPRLRVLVKAGNWKKKGFFPVPCTPYA
ncbi:Membrane steroid-binding protein 1 [Asimina triloba]